MLNRLYSIQDLSENIQKITTFKKLTELCQNLNIKLLLELNVVKSSWDSTSNGLLDFNGVIHFTLYLSGEQYGGGWEKINFLSAMGIESLEGEIVETLKRYIETLGRLSKHPQQRG